MIIGLQIVAILFALSMIYFALHSYKRGELGAMEIISWLLMWALVIVVVVFPELLRSFAGKFFVTRVFDLMVVGGFILVIMLSVASYMRSKRLEKKIEEMVRKDAITKLKGKK
jgi:hypothetical protein